MSLAIRPMTPSDLDALAELNQSAFEHPWTRDLLERELRNEWSTVLLAEVGDALIGFIVVWKVYDEVHILNVATHPTRRRQGVGEALMQAAHALGRSQGARLSTLEVRASNASAQALYRKLGYAQVGLRKGYYPGQAQAPAEDAVIMTLQWVT